MFNLLYPHEATRAPSFCRIAVAAHATIEDSWIEVFASWEKRWALKRKKGNGVAVVKAKPAAIKSSSKIEVSGRL